MAADMPPLEPLGVRCDHNGKGMYWCEKCTPTLRQIGEWLGETTRRLEALTEPASMKRPASECDHKGRGLYWCERCEPTKQLLSEYISEQIHRRDNLIRDALEVLSHIGAHPNGRVVEARALLTKALNQSDR